MWFFWQLDMILLVLFFKLNSVEGVSWDKIRCSSDTVVETPDGTVANIGRFPWLGIVQHTFTVGQQTRFAVTSAVLIHPAFAIASAQDIANIQRDEIRNTTLFILWYSESIKYAMPVRDYILHPEYEEKRTLATIALINIITSGETGAGDNPNPVLPACMPLKGVVSFDNVYVAKMTDENKEIQKEFYKMNIVDQQDCEKFYINHNLNQKIMKPSLPTCAMVERAMPACVWDSGATLITRQSWGYWTLLGFSARGAGCGAPARFLMTTDYLPWINDMISPRPSDKDINLHRIGARSLSPTKFILYDASIVFPAGQGQCEKRTRGNVIYKDSFEVLASADLGQGYFFVTIQDVAAFSCAVVDMKQVSARSNAAVWIEHNCYRQLTGLAGQMQIPWDLDKQQCYLYFKTKAFIEFRFLFSFKALIEVTLFGHRTPLRLQSPWQKGATTEAWWPTTTYFEWGHFQPKGHLGAAWVGNGGWWNM